MNHEHCFLCDRVHDQEPPDHVRLEDVAGEMNFLTMDKDGVFPLKKSPTTNGASQRPKVFHPQISKGSQWKRQKLGRLIHQLKSFIATCETSAHKFVLACFPSILFIKFETILSKDPLVPRPPNTSLLLPNFSTWLFFVW